MTDTAKDPIPNPPAFPRAIGFDGLNRSSPSQPGMTLRDHFAGEALAQTILLMADSAPFPAANEDDGFARAVARLCYQMADAMLAERVAVQS